MVPVITNSNRKTLILLIMTCILLKPIIDTFQCLYHNARKYSFIFGHFSKRSLQYNEMVFPQKTGYKNSTRLSNYYILPESNDNY